MTYEMFSAKFKPCTEKTSPPRVCRVLGVTLRAASPAAGSAVCTASR